MVTYSIRARSASKTTGCLQSKTEVSWAEWDRMQFGKMKGCNLFSQNAVADVAQMQSWISHFQTSFGVFFSSPLDIDFAMLEAFPSTYKKQADRGPQLPDKTKDLNKFLEVVSKRTKQVLASDPATAPATTGDTYSPEQRELFPWYKYLFLNGSKPVAHMRAMISLESGDLLKDVPAVLKQLVEAARSCMDTPGRTCPMTTMPPGTWRPKGVDSLEPAAELVVRSNCNSLVIAGPGGWKDRTLGTASVFSPLETGAMSAPEKNSGNFVFKRDAAKKP